LWAAIKARWSEVEKLLADRQAVLGTLTGTPGNTRKKTYVFNTQHITLIDRYAQEHRLDLKDVIYTMCQEFFQRRGYLDE
jgi:N-acyl-D-aspartate/D-glutamate deacylase